MPTGWSDGVFYRAYNWVADKAASIKIVASRMDGEFDNYKTGLENCITRDNQTPPTAAISWNSQKITSLANGTASTDAVNLGQVTGLTTGNAFRRNLLINGGFDVWQAGAGGSASIAGTASRVRTADCWWAVRATSATGYTVSQQTGTVNRYALKWQRDNANASTAVMYLAQSLETANVVRLKRGTPPTCYLSFYAKSGANYSGGNLTVDVVRGTGSDENVLDTYTGATTLATLAQAITGTMTRYSVSVPIDTSTNELGVRFSWTPSGVAGADDSVTLENVQLEVASAATDFEYLPFDDTLRRCMRYYQKSFLYSIAPASSLGFSSDTFAMMAGRAGASTNVFCIPLPVVMKGSNTTTTSYNPYAAGSEARDVTAGATCSAMSINSTTPSRTLYGTFTGNAATAVGNNIQFEYTISEANF